MVDNNTIIKRATDLIFLKYKRDEIALLMDLLFDHVSKQKDFSVLHSFMVNGVIDRLTLVSAIQMVCGEFVVASGHMRFLPEINFEEKTVVWSFRRHHWLMWQEDGYIIDVLPSDGEFGVSVPQAVITTSVSEKRFFRDVGISVPNISLEEKIAFDKQFSALVSLLEMLQQKIPF